MANTAAGVSSGGISRGVKENLESLNSGEFICAFRLGNRLACKSPGERSPGPGCRTCTGSTRPRPRSGKAKNIFSVSLPNFVGK